ncbi:EpsG family protein, partial [Fusobacterium varium]|uniref:EpsG family protein n=1 Tax=Fusobacterium varium TaxID=856 RepID=UPI0022E27D83
MYHLNLCLISIISLFRRSKLTTYLIYLLLIYLSIFDGTRFETGPDWDSYLLHFYKGEYSQNFEWMYNKYVEFFRIIYPNYNVFLFIISLFLYFSLFKKIMIYSKSNVSLIVLYSMVVPYIGINRQLISIGIIVYSIKYILEK